MFTLNSTSNTLTQWATTLGILLAGGLGSIFLLDNLRFKVSTMVAGLGIGGVAVALGSRAIAGVIGSVPTARLDRAHLAALGASSLDFEVPDYVLSSDYTIHMDTQQTIQLKILRDFHDRGVSFAYPTQMIYHQAAGARP